MVVFQDCCHIYRNSTPTPCLPGELTPEMLAYATKRVCPSCASEIERSRARLKHIGKGFKDPKLPTNSLLMVEWHIRWQFMDASRKDFEATKEPPVGQLANYLLLMRQLSVFAWELQNEAAAHGGADRFVIGATIVVFGKEFLAGDAWKGQSERELRKRLDGSFPKAMRIILAMKPTCDLVTDVRATLSDVFKTKPTIHAEQAHAFLRDLDCESITKDG